MLWNGGNSQSRVLGLSLARLSSNLVLKPFQLVFRNVVHVSVESRDNARSEGDEQPVDESLNDSALHLILRMDSVYVPGASPTSRFFPGKKSFAEQTV